MKKTLHRNLLIIFFIVLSFIFGFSFNEISHKNQSNSVAKNTNNKSEPKEGIYKVKKVIDGDSIILDTGERIRYEGIDAPEVNVRWGPEAKSYNEKLVLGKKVQIELDRRKIDIYGRTLAYVWIENSMVNEQLLEEGYARVQTMQGAAKLRYIERLRNVENSAKDSHYGIWLDEWIQK